MRKGFGNLEHLYKAILTIIYGKGLPLSWSRNGFLQSYCVDNMKTSGASYMLECIFWRGDVPRAGAEGDASLPFFPGHHPAFTGPSDSP